MNAILAYNNLARGLTPVFDPADANYPASRLAGDRGDMRAWLGADTGTITYDLGIWPGEVNFVSLCNHNLPSGTTITVAANATNAWGAPSYGPTAITWRETNAWLKIAAAPTYRYWQFSITAPSGTPAVGFIFLGSYVELSQNPRRGYSITDNQVNRRSATSYGAARSYTLPAQKTLALPLRVNATARAQWEDLQAAVYGAERPFVFVPDPDTEASAHLVRLTSDFPWSSQGAGDIWDGEIELAVEETPRTLALSGTFITEIARPRVDLTPLVELALDGATHYFAPCAIETPTQPYEGRITSIGAIDRKLDTPWSDAGFTQFDITLANEDGELSAWDHDTLLNRVLTVKIAANTQTETFFTGIVTNWEFRQGELSLTVADKGFNYFGEKNRWWAGHELTSADWPDLESGWEGKPFPLRFGVFDSTGAGFGGMIRCVKLSPTIYMIAGHAMAAVSQIFVGGEQQPVGSFTVDLEAAHSKGWGGYICTVTFGADPGGEVTADGRGMTSTKTSGGYLLTNPVEIAEVLREDIFGLPDGDVDSALIAAAKTHCETYRLRTGGQITDTGTPADILSSLLACAWLFSGWDYQGKWGIHSLELPLTTGGGTAVKSLTDIIADSFSYKTNLSALCNHLTVNFRPDAGGGYRGQWVRQNSDSQTDLARAYRHEINLEWVEDPDTAWTVGGYMVLMLAYLYDTDFATQLQHEGTLDLGSLVNLAEPYGPDTAGEGWSAKEGFITGRAFDPDACQVTTQAIDVSKLTQAVLGAPFTLGTSELPGAIQ